MSLQNAVQVFEVRAWSGVDSAVAAAETVGSLQAFAAAVQQTDWEKLCPVFSMLNGTPDVVLNLGVGWEAAWRHSRGAIDDAAVRANYVTLLPQELRDAWDQAQQGLGVQVLALDSFWAHQLSVPFRHWPRCK